MRPTANSEATVALRKESVDRNISALASYNIIVKSLSARRAWIEIVTSIFIAISSKSLSARRAWIEMGVMRQNPGKHYVALRKESVDRNFCNVSLNYKEVLSLSARRAWIEIWA